MHLSAAEIARRAAGEVVAGDPAAVASSWGFDSRTLLPGACFVALQGHRDGHDFVGDAFRAGASVALVARDVPEPAGGAVVRVADTLLALQEVARSVRGDRAELRVFAVAGSTGKTSTKDLLAAALSTRAVHANPESYNNEFGLPVTLLNTPSFAEVVVTEMGERFPGDLASLCAIARPEVGIVTNVGLAHAEHLGGREGATRAFAELVDALPPGGLIVLNADDDSADYLAARARSAVLTVGFDGTASYRITDAELARDLRPTFRLAGVDVEFSVPLRGAHQIRNAAMAAVAAHHGAGVGWDDVGAGLAEAQTGRWRMEVVERRDDVVVLNDAYNANPDSMDAALRALAHVPARGRRIAVLGDMRELGWHAPGAHAEIGRLAGALGVDVVVGVGEGGAAIVEAADAVAERHVVVDAVAARAFVTALVRSGDVVLVKASRALGLQTVADALLAEGAVP